MIRRVVHTILLFGVLCSMASFNTTLPTDYTADLQVEYQATGTIEGYSKITKLKVYIDGIFVGESEPKDQREKNSLRVKVPQGVHRVQCYAYALLDSKWELRDMKNEYSFDWIYDAYRTFPAKSKLVLDFSVTSKKTSLVSFGKMK